MHHLPTVQTATATGTTIASLVASGKRGEPHHRSSGVPFFINDPRPDDASEPAPHAWTQEQLTFLHDHFPPWLRHVYLAIDCPHSEWYSPNNDWTVMSFDEMHARHTDVQQAREDKPPHAIAVAYTYCGMGWIRLLSVDVATGKMFTHLGGGSSGYDRELNHIAYLAYDSEQGTLEDKAVALIDQEDVLALWTTMST